MAGFEGPWRDLEPHLSGTVATVVELPGVSNAAMTLSWREYSDAQRRWSWTVRQGCNYWGLRHD
jgi:hypothetical protein